MNRKRRKPGNHVSSRRIRRSASNPPRLTLSSCPNTRSCVGVSAKFTAHATYNNQRKHDYEDQP